MKNLYTDSAYSPEELCSWYMPSFPAFAIATDSSGNHWVHSHCSRAMSHTLTHLITHWGMRSL